MRPVNLIPPEERRGRTGARGALLAYLVLGGLFAALVAVVLLVITANQISSRESELSHLKHQTASAEKVANDLAPYVTFQTVSKTREETVTNLANSRFDWQRVLTELALILPEGVELSALSGSASPAEGASGGESVSLRGESAGPGLSMSGCAASQQTVAEFLSALKDIDGVTRVGLQSSSSAAAEGSGGGSVSASGTCARKSSAHFQIAVVFDAAPVPAPATGEETVAVAEPVSEEASGQASGEESGSTETTSGAGE